MRISLKGKWCCGGLAPEAVWHNGRRGLIATFQDGLGKPFFKSLRLAFAFTLIELLLVIAIIGILAALLMTAVVRSKNQAAKVVDMNNLRQIAIVMHLYSDDSNGHLAWVNLSDGDTNGAGWLYKNDYSVPPGPDEKKVETGLFWKTLQNSTLYWCPLDLMTNHQWFQWRAQQASSYVMNAAPAGYGRLIYPCLRLERMAPDAIAFYEPDENNPAYFNDGANYPNELIDTRHGGGGMVLTFGGSAELFKQKDWTAEEAITNRNRLWCYPDSPDGR